MEQHNGLAMSRQYRQEHDLNMIPVKNDFSWQVF